MPSIIGNTFFHELGCRCNHLGSVHLPLGSTDCDGVVDLVARCGRLHVAYSMLCIAQTKYGLGLPIELRPAASADTYAKVNFAVRPVYQTMIVVFLAHAGCALSITFACSPVKKS